MNRVLNSLVTGGVQGIGLAIVEKLLGRGDNVFVFDIVGEDSEQVSNIKKLGAKYITVDISSFDSIKKGFLQIPNLDLLVNNAGVTKDGLAIRMSEQDWDFVFNVNLKGTFFCCQQAIKKMMVRKKGYIVNLSSIVGITGNPGQVNYAASKAGVISLTKTLAQEYGVRNILVNAIAPGFIQTSMTNKLPEQIKGEIISRISLKRLGKPEEIANLVCFLSSGMADYITGEVLNINGGMF